LSSLCLPSGHDLARLNGEKLFFDSRLSGDGTVSCATCHDPERAFTDGRPVSVGIHGRVGQCNAPTLLNALYNKTQFWDGRVNSLEEQAALPITNPFEMGSASLRDIVEKISGDPDYQVQFKQAFAEGVNEQKMLRAIATYERTLVSFDSPFDHFIAGDKNAISSSAARGWELFNTKARCNLCHALTDKERDITVFTDNDFHNIGIGYSGIASLRWRSRLSTISRQEIYGLSTTLQSKASCRRLGAS